MTLCSCFLASYGTIVSVGVYDSGRSLPWTVYQEMSKELYNNLAGRPNSEDLEGHSVDEICVGSCKDFPGHCGRLQ